MVANKDRPTRVAILGGGPCGSTIAALLADKGVDVTLFTDGKRPELIVGESLIPGLIPIFRRLGVEEEIAEISHPKPGATFRFGEEGFFELSFSAVEGLLPTYAYNSPRPALDEIIEKRARSAGANFVEKRAKLRKGSDENREVVLTPETLEMVPEWGGKHPDLIIDATGRSRQICKMLDIPARIGPRKDVAYFAHYEDFEPEGPEGQIIISRLPDSGWSWQIPLCGCISVGVVLNKDVAAKFGKTPEERLEAIIDSDPHLAKKGKKRKKISKVPVYTNYQLITERGYGPGWVAAGDAYGFVDPMLSPGLYIAMWSAELVADMVPSRPPVQVASEMRRYSERMYKMIDSWHTLIEAFYDGTLFSSYKTGEKRRMKFDHWIADKISKHIERNVAGMACGALTDAFYSQNLLKVIRNYGIKGFDPADLAIR